MNILLIHTYFKKNEKAYPVSIGYLSSILKKKSHLVFGADLSFDSLEQIIGLVNRESIEFISVSSLPYGIGSVYYDFEKIISFCRELKSEINLPLVLNGPYISVFGKDLFHQYNNCFDYLIKGEPESIIPKLIDYFQNNCSLEQIENLIFRTNNQIKENNYQPAAESLDSYPYPDRDLFPILKYKGMITKNKDYTQIITSRGCKHSCSYCFDSFLVHEQRLRSAGNIIGEIKSIIKKFGIKEFHFEDANFFGGKTKKVKEICELIIKENINIDWQCPNGFPASDVDDLGVFKIMKKAGCYSICLGIESFDPISLYYLKRKSEYKQTKKVVKAAQSAGLEVTGYFMVGIPGQSLKALIKDIYLSQKLNLDFLHYSIFKQTPYSKKIIKQLNINVLILAKFVALFINCFRPKTYKFLYNSFVNAKNPIIIIKKAIAFLLDKDI